MTEHPESLMPNETHAAYRSDLKNDLKDPGYAVKYLGGALADSKEAFTVALRDVVEAHGLLSDALRHECERVLEAAAKLVDEGDCLPGCDSIMHEELCPQANPGNAIRALAKQGDKP